jgi:hypothetical protein
MAQPTSLNMLPINQPVAVGGQIDVTRGLPTVQWHQGPDSQVVGSINCFGGNVWGDTTLHQAAGLYSQGPSIPRASQTDCVPMTS